MSENLRNVTGTVFNIQHYCIHDGPGIRTNVFVKGCPLRCAWCANPESQSGAPQLMYLADRCTGCGACIAACPRKAVSRRGDRPELVQTDRTLCTACGVCVKGCPTEARSISGRVMTAGEAFDEVAGDRLFYGADGGLTVTGGEALAHPEFTGALARLCREAGIGTAVETCGAVPWEVMAPVLEHTDIVLYDIKQMDSARHRQYTGQGNELILSNLERISGETDCAIIVRCPVIPPCNDGPEEMHALGRFLTEKKIRCDEVDLLPYHNLGEGKRTQLEPGDEGFHTQAPPDWEVEALRDILRGYGFLVK